MRKVIYQDLFGNTVTPITPPVSLAVKEAIKRKSKPLDAKAKKDSPDANKAALEATSPEAEVSAEEEKSDVSGAIS